MIRAGYLSSEDGADLIALARDGSAAHRFARRANALVLLDDGWSCERVAAALFLDDDGVRRWHALFLEDGLEGLTRFDSGGGASRLSKIPGRGVEVLDRRSLAALDAPSRCVYRTRIWRRL